MILKKINSMSKEELFKSLRYDRYTLMFIICFYGVLTAILFVYAANIDFMVAWLCLVVAEGSLLVLLMLTYYFKYLIYFLKYLKHE